MTDWHRQSVDDSLSSLQSDVLRGLEEAQAAQRLAQEGPNQLVESGARSPWRILWEQFTSTMVLILLGAALVSALLGEFKDAAAIGGIVLLFAFLGFYQEYRAEQAMAALKRLSTPNVRVVRSGTLRELSSTELVRGDLILLEAGNMVPADIRLVESTNLRIQEAALTGESEAVEKLTAALHQAELPLGDRQNMGYMGTIVTYGRGKGLVVHTGMNTELGKIATLLQNVEQEQTPLQKRLDQLGKLLAVVGVLVAVLVLIGGLLRGEPLRDMLLTSVSIAVAIIPEGLPAVVTITLALGAQRMLRRRALIRKLPAVETLGSVTVICSDKTGTLTENRMTVMILDVAGHQIQLNQVMHQRMPAIEGAANPYGEAPLPAFSSLPDAIPLLIAGGALCNDAALLVSPETGRYQTVGDPTEGALLIAAAQFGVAKDDLEGAMPRLAEAPFDSERKRMTTVHRFDPQQVAGRFPSFQGLEIQQPYLAFAKGAVDGLLEIAGAIWLEGRAVKIDEHWRTRIQSANDNLAQQGMRVLGVAFRPLDALPAQGQVEALEHDLILLGLVGMIDPPRPEVESAVRTSLMAGIRPVMITGDHPLTARQIASELGILANGGSQRVLTGAEINRMDDAELAGQVEQISVYARVSPEHKLRIVRALQSLGHVVSMTGDGVNDAPALKQADIGVAMGITGTDVSKEASEMVLQDDNFATIVAAVEEGRTIYENLRKFIKFSVAGNIGKVSVMLLAPLLGKPLPLAPLQLLWLNLLTDGLLGLGLGMEPPEKDVMRRPPYSPQEGIFSGGLGRHVLWVGALIGALALSVGYVYWRIDPNGTWQTMTFTTLAFSQLAQAMATRSRVDSIFTTGIRSNPTGMLLALLVFGLQIAALYLPALQSILQTQPLSISDLLLSLALSSLVLIAIEIEKWLARRKMK